MKIVNHRGRGNEKVLRARRVPMRQTRTNDISSSLSRKYSAIVHIAFSPLFFHESIKRAQFHRGIFIGVDNPNFRATSLRYLRAL